MILENKNCKINITTDETYIINSKENYHYDVILNLDNYGQNDLYKVLSVSIDLFYKEYKMALVGSYLAYDIDCALLEDVVLTVLQDDRITQINVINGKVINHKKLDCFGSNFGIYKVDTGYIIHGEIEITKWDLDFNKKWSFSGRDIFVSITGKQSMTLLKDRICLYDFYDYYYEIDYDGNQINSRL